MAEITRRRTGELLRKLFEIVIPQTEGMQAGQALDELAKRIKLTEYESGYYESGSQRFVKIVRFASIDCVKAGWLTKHKGKWSITEGGKEAYLQYTDPEAFYKRAVKLYHEWKAKQLPTSTTKDELETDGSAKEVSITYEQAEEQAWTEIERYLKNTNPYDFQELVAALLRAMGYHIAWIAPPGKDGGIDILAYSDPLGTRPPRIKVQVKRVEHNISVEGLRSFMVSTA